MFSLQCFAFLFLAIHQLVHISQHKILYRNSATDPKLSQSYCLYSAARFRTELLPTSSSNHSYILQVELNIISKVGI